MGKSSGVGAAQATVGRPKGVTVHRLSAGGYKVGRNAKGTAPIGKATNTAVSKRK